MKSIRRLISILSLTASLCSCRVGPKYHEPQFTPPIQWKNQELEEEPVLPNYCNWWEVFHDSVLNHLEWQALENNKDIHIALSRIAQARATSLTSQAALFPQLSFSPAGSKINGPVNLTPLDRLRPLTTILPPISLKNIDIAYLLLPINLSYEIDLWQKNQRLFEVDYYNYQAQEEAYRTAMLSLTTNLADVYFNLRTSDKLLKVLAAILEIRKENLRINRSRFEKGLSTKIDLSQAEEEFYSAEADYYQTLGQRGTYENAIATLIGLPASQLTIALQPLEFDPPKIPIGLPSELLLRRPDIAQAERQMASSHAKIGAAYASFFPSLNLNSAFEYLTLELKHLFKARSRLFSVGFLADQTLFDGGRKSANLLLAKAQFEESLENYEKIILQAFQEVEDSLVTLQNQSKQFSSLSRALASATDTTTLSNKRYKSGLVNYTEVIQNQRIQYDLELNHVRLQGQRYQATIQLIKALGGNWNAMEVSTIEELQCEE
ncbi:Outer membrane protein OprM precursor [Candidatus Rubidus massiliensis]|nr:Outer membrane protein OprM precursor [Candidatus Rubidus massiliensis]